MELDELIREIEKMEMLSRQVSHQKLAGLFNSSFKGRGVSLDAIRRYEPGDDVRDINWNVTARFQETYINTFTEDKERLIWILLDTSGSGRFSTSGKSKFEIAVLLAATLAYSAVDNNDRVGVICFNGKVQQVIQPARGMLHFWRIAKELVSLKPQGRSAGLNEALEFLMKINNKSSLVFLLSDFMETDYAPSARILAQQHQLAAIRIFDEKEKHLPTLGWVNLLDSETGKAKWVNTFSGKFKKEYQAQFEKVEAYFEQAFISGTVNKLSLSSRDNYQEKLFSFLYSHA